MKFSTTIYDRDFGSGLATPVGLTLTVQRYSFAVPGGPDAATITARGPEAAIAELIQRLRCPIEIYDEAGALMWWGFINQVTASLNGFEFGASLDSMSNRVAVAYSFVTPGSADVGTRKTTAWADDADSVDEYGYKDLLSSLDGATDAQAILARDLILAQYKYPVATWQSAAMADGTAQIVCSGWWSALDWRMYANSGTDSIATTTQIDEAITAAGQFFPDTSIETASGIDSSEYQDGDSTLRTVVEALLAGGTSAGARLTALVTKDRLARILAEPAAGASDYQWLRDGSLYDSVGARVDARECPAGMWLTRPDIGSINLGQLISPLQTFVTRAEFDAATGIYRPEVRGVPGPFEIAEWVRR